MRRSKAPPSPKIDLGAFSEGVLMEQIRRADERRTVLHVPSLRDHVMEHPGLHFHFNPDLIIGVEGATRFEFIHDQFVVEAGALAVIPGGIPHREIFPQGKSAAFKNLVVSVYNETVSIQLQTATEANTKVEMKTEYFDTNKHQSLAHYLEEIAELAHGHGEEQRLGIKGLLLIYLSTLESVVRQGRHSAPVEKLKISQTKRLVQEHLGQSTLGVRFLSGMLHCSSDYLSNLFHRETGQRLTSYINVERIKAATTMLRSTPLTVAEVAYAVGFESQGYFSRVFKQIALKSPMDYRRSIEHAVVELEGRPRTIYAPPGR